MDACAWVQLLLRFASASAPIAEGVRLICTQAQDPGVDYAIERAAQFFGFGVANVVSMPLPEMVENGGGMAKMGERLLAPLRGEVARCVKMCPLDKLQIEASLSSPRAGTLGCLVPARRRGVI